jgi:GT2 family glycosyltransferase
MQITILICTHNRADLLRRTLDFLNRADRPEDCDVEVLVIANACTDGTHKFLESYVRDTSSATPLAPAPLPRIKSGAGPEGRGDLPLRWETEPAPGKSHALNRAIPLLEHGWVAFVDDDHRVREDYLVSICDAIKRYPEASLFCGRILPDWDGSEPSWVHDNGPYRIYPLPVPRYDLGDEPMRIPCGKSTPGGGNLVVRTDLFAKAGRFSTDYGPVGHDLAGAEDQEWVKRALEAGAQLQYLPGMVQYHYVDPARLRLGYLIRKAYQRSASVIRLSKETLNLGFIPTYMLRKVARYWLAVALSTNHEQRRFHLVRLAASLGEIKGHLRARKDRGTGATQTQMDG